MKAEDYERRLRIPLESNGKRIRLKTLKGNVEVASDYVRVVIGARGPYVEFFQLQLLMKNIKRGEGRHFYYDEYRTADGVKVYHQRVPVDYANYVPGRWYVSPFELATLDGAALIEPLAAAPAAQSSIFDVLGAP